jgi:hypothetical protein
MTVIAAITDGKVGHIASDSQESDEMSGTKRLDCKKIYEVANGWVWGACGDCIIENFLNDPEYTYEMWGDADADPYLLREWVSEMFDEMSYEYYKDSLGSPYPGAQMVPQDLIFGKAGKLWLVDGSTYQREIKPGVFWGVGSGHVLATGAAHAMMADGMLPSKELVERACTAAIDRDMYCGGDLQYLSV